MKEYAASSTEFAKKFESMMTTLHELGYKE